MIYFVSSSAENTDLLTGKDLGVAFKVVVALHALINVLILNKGELSIPYEQIVLNLSKPFAFLNDFIFIH